MREWVGDIESPLPTAVGRGNFSLALAALIAILVPGFAFANEMTVDERRVAAHDLVTITVSLEDAFAELEEMSVPLRNLVIVGEPWTATEFAFINGRVVRRKVFRYRARPIAAGTAQIGPLILRTDDGQIDTLAAIEVEVLPDRTSGSNDAEVVLRELVAAGRDPLFVIAETDKKSVYAGEPVIVEWILYNAASIQQWQIVSVPKLADFWVEELTKNERAERVYVADLMMQRVPIRRAALFPLRSGRLQIGGTTVEAAVMRRAPSGPFSRFEGVLAETTFTSAPLEIDVNPIPPGPSVDAVGDLALDCSAPQQRNGGPVVIRATVAGAGNVRSVAAPRFDRNVAGDVQIEGGEVTVAREEGPFGMSRQWRYLVFPAKSGMLEIPPLSMRVFVPVTSEHRELRCSAAFIDAATAVAPQAAPKAGGSRPSLAAPRWPWAIAIALLVGVGAMIPRALRTLSLRRQVREVLRNATPAEIRARVESRVPIDPHERSDRGDAMRALRSLLDAAERDRDIAVGAEKEIARRVAEVLRMRN